MGPDDFFRMTMRITCPRCAAIYDVPQSRLAARRTVRCSRCSALWQPAPQSAAAHEPIDATHRSLPASPVLASTEPVIGNHAQTVGAPAATNRDDGMDVLAADGSNPPPARPFLTHDHRVGSGTDTPPAKASDTASRASWIVPMAIILAAIFATGYWRTDIMRAWPPSALILSMFGGATQPSDSRNFDSDRK